MKKILCYYIAGYSAGTGYPEIFAGYPIKSVSGVTLFCHPLDLNFKIVTEFKLTLNGGYELL